jgi:hypothetical protein
MHASGLQGIESDCQGSKIARVSQSEGDHHGTKEPSVDNNANAAPHRNLVERQASQRVTHYQHSTIIFH